MYHRVGFTAARSAELWERWKKGEGIVGRAFGKPSSCIFAHRGRRLISCDGPKLIPTGADDGEREENLEACGGPSVRRNSEEAGPRRSTVSREINPDVASGRNRPAAAASSHGSRRCAQAVQVGDAGPLRQAVVGELELNSARPADRGWLKRASRIDRERGACLTSTIYRSLYVQARGVLKKELLEHLRSRRPIRRSRHATAKADQRGRIPDAVSISERPASVEDRAVPGHWEGDLLCGSKNSYIVTLVERHSRYVMLAKVANRETQTVVDALIRQARKLPDELYRSLTWDRGKELADHKRFSMETDIDVYFCDPQSPGSVAQAKTPIACCASTSPRALILRGTPRPS